MHSTPSRPFGRGIRRLRISRSILRWSCGLAMLTGCTETAQRGGGGWRVPTIFAGHKDKPAGQEWTILCMEAVDEGRVRTCNALATSLRRVDRLDASKVRAVHEDGVSRIYYGSYYRRIDKDNQRETFGPKVLGDLQFIRRLAAGERFPFAAARLVPTPTPDCGRPECEISRCPGRYTLHIGVFYNTTTFNQRKEAAVQWVEQLRAEGVEAYYQHGQVRSSVTVGHFSERDILREKRTGPNAAAAPARTRYSPKVEAFRNQERFKYNLENGCKIKQTRNTADGFQKVYQKSFLIPVPKKEQRATDAY